MNQLEFCVNFPFQFSSFLPPPGRRCDTVCGHSREQVTVLSQQVGRHVGYLAQPSHQPRGRDDHQDSVSVCNGYVSVPHII